MNPLVHLELQTAGAPAAGAFYTGLLGWRAQRVHSGSASYTTLGSGGPVGAGVVESCAEQPLWLPYVAVECLQSTTERALALGATLLLGPREGQAGRRSVLASPAGGQIALWQPGCTRGWG
jgi:uncharacterized protein